ncbi:PREDICTED: floral homeotic protein PMADS 2 [Nelumbo nucifera]|uniref:Floral homeotic protein PMADS 2 n=2 Tax=Nelumbo nucifera TaxID=4432 RepID=A0A1U8ARU1_NELNU|nr:PREDICTED: floral homeotic protein PMADS 2 [Nelumbo nucifera]
MGRGKIEIKRIENSTNRQVTYSKRRNGIMKKAKEITVLCDAEVSLVIFSSTGKMSEYCSPNTTLIKLLDRYQKSSGKRLWDAKHEFLSNEIDRIKKENDAMQIELRHLKGEDINSLTPKELIPIEEALENGLVNVRAKQMEYLKMLEKNGRTLEEDNNRLNFILHHQQMGIDNGVREMENGYHQKGRNYSSSSMPLAFRVQPIQPNLQESK